MQDRAGVSDFRNELSDLQSGVGDSNQFIFPKFVSIYPVA